MKKSIIAATAWMVGFTAFAGSEGADGTDYVLSEESGNTYTCSTSIGNYSRIVKRGAGEVELTMAAAGSEMSDSAVLTNLALGKKSGIKVDFNRCKFAIMNPELTMTLPRYQIGAGAADIFMHTSERYFGEVVRGNHLTDEIAEGLFRDIIEYGPKGVQDPQDYEAMSEIMWCGSVSHVGLTGLGVKGEKPREGDWACHQLGMAISALYDSTHGATLTAVWAAWCRYVMGKDIARFAQFARKVYGDQGRRKLGLAHVDLDPYDDIT